MSGFGLGADPGGKPGDRQPIAVDAETRKHRDGGHGGEGVVTEALAGVDIADVHLDGGDRHRLQRVMQCDRGMGIGAGVDDDAGGIVRMRLMDEVDQFALMVGLSAIGRQSELRGGLFAELFDIGEVLAWP